jgi:large subunit ribosomal protein L1
VAHGKRYREAATKIERERLYEATDALALLKELPPAKFDETLKSPFV